LGLRDELTGYTKSILRTNWVVEDWERVPTEGDALALTAKGVRIDATVMYADLRDSTGLVKDRTDTFAAEIYKMYVYAAAKAIRAYDGEVTAYDGDRVMGIFVGGQMRNQAVEASFLLSAIVSDLIQPEIDDFYKTASYQVRQKVGIDHSKLLATNSGIRGNTEYVWIGTAANNAAKMAALRRGYETYVSSDVHGVLTASNLTHGSGTPVWDDLGSSDLGYRIYGANTQKTHIPNW